MEIIDRKDLIARAVVARAYQLVIVPASPEGRYRLITAKGLLSQVESGRFSEISCVTMSLEDARGILKDILTSKLREGYTIVDSLPYTAVGKHTTVQTDSLSAETAAAAQLATGPVESLDF